MAEKKTIDAAIQEAAEKAVNSLCEKLAKRILSEAEKALQGLNAIVDEEEDDCSYAAMQRRILPDSWLTDDEKAAKAAAEAAKSSKKAEKAAEAKKAEAA